MKLKMHDGSIYDLKQVRHGPNLKRNLISLGMMDQIECIINVQHGVLSVVKGSLVLLKENGLYVFEGNTITGEVFMSSSFNFYKIKLWHLRLGHMSIKGLRELSKQGLLGNNRIEDLVFCEDCVLGKYTRTSFKSSIYTTKDIMEYIHSDLGGPTQDFSLRGSIFFFVNN